MSESDTNILLAAINGAENRLREDIRNLGARLGAVEVLQGKHDVKIQELEKESQASIASLLASSQAATAAALAATQSATAAALAKSNGNKEKGESWSWSTAWGALIEAPKLWHILVIAATLILGLSTLTKKIIP